MKDAGPSDLYQTTVGLHRSISNCKYIASFDCSISWSCRELEPKEAACAGRLTQLNSFEFVRVKDVLAKLNFDLFHWLENWE